MWWKLRQVRGTRSTFAGRQTGREDIDIVPNREAIARYGLTMRDVQDVVEAAVGGMPVSTAIAGRARFSINLRYAAEDYGGMNAGAGASAHGSVATSAGGGGGGMGSMSGGGGQAGTAASGGASAGLAAPPMIKDENGVLVGYVFADIDQTERDLGGWVKDAKQLVASRLTLPAGYRLQWTGQYEFLAEIEARLRFVLPLTLLLVVALLYLSMRGWPQTFLVLSSQPFAVAGSVWLLALSCMVLTLLVLPAAYAMWRRRQIRVAMAVSRLGHPVPAAAPGAA